MNRNVYSEEETKTLLSLYNDLGVESVEEIAEIMGKPVRSVRSKLVREGVYKSHKPTYERKTGTSKKELLLELEALVDFDTTGFFGATKDSLHNLINFIKKDEE